MLGWASSLSPIFWLFPSPIVELDLSRPFSSLSLSLSLMFDSLEDYRWPKNFFQLIDQELNLYVSCDRKSKVYSVKKTFFSEFGGIVWPTAQSVDRQPFSHSRKIQVQFSKPRTNLYEGLRSEPTKLKKSHDWAQTDISFNAPPENALLIAALEWANSVWGAMAQWAMLR